MFDDRSTRRLTDEEARLEAAHLGLATDGPDIAAIRAAVSAERGRRWLEENAEALAAHAAWVEKNGLVLDRYRRF